MINIKGYFVFIEDGKVIFVFKMLCNNEKIYENVIEFIKFKDLNDFK